MNAHADAGSMDELLSHAAWVRRVAARLVHDAAGADDLAQDVWLTVLRERPTGLERPRAWLASVARTLAFTRGRSDARRSRRELAGGGAGSAAPADDVVAEAESEREVARLVLELEEPYRTVLLYRFYRDLPPRRIATELGRPVATVKVQIQRGLERLRARLDREHGDRGAWCALLLPLAARETGSPIALGILAWTGLLAASFGLWLALAPAAPESEQATDFAQLREAVPGTDADRVANELQTPPSAPRAAAPAGRVEAARTPQADRTPLILPAEFEPMRVRVVSLEGEPLAGVRVHVGDPARLSLGAGGAIVASGVWLRVPSALRRMGERAAQAREEFLRANFLDPREARALLAGVPLPPESGVTDSRGLVTLEVSVPWVDFVLDDPELTLLGWGPPRRVIDGETRVLFAARSHRLSGRVVDDRGLAIAEAEVRVHSGCPPQLNSELELGRGLSSGVRRAITSLNGSFVLPRVPRSSVLVVTAEHQGVSCNMTLDLSGDLDPEPLELVLEIVPESERLILTGTVVSAGGSAVRAATVALGGVATTTDESGSFELPLGRFEAAEPLAIVAPGFAPRLEPGYGAWLQGTSGTRATGPLRLDEEAGVIGGRVVDALGNPLAGLAVELVDPTRVRGISGSLEDLAAGRSLGPVETDAQGRFRIRGLFPREYTLRIGDGSQGSTHGPIPAGSRQLLLRADPVRGR